MQRMVSCVQSPESPTCPHRRGPIRQSRGGTARNLIAGGPQQLRQDEYGLWGSLCPGSPFAGESHQSTCGHSAASPLSTERHDASPNPVCTARHNHDPIGLRRVHRESAPAPHLQRAKREPAHCPGNGQCKVRASSFAPVFADQASPMLLTIWCSLADIP
jgi:hypothetical protein